jgi:hypothetical protein
MKIHVEVFGVMTPCCVAVGCMYRRFGGPCCLCCQCFIPFCTAQSSCLFAVLITFSSVDIWLYVSRIRSFGLFQFTQLTSETVNLFRFLVGFLGWGIGPSQGLYTYTEQNDTKKTRTYIHASSRIRTHEEAKTIGALNRAATGTSVSRFLSATDTKSTEVFKLEQERVWKTWSTDFKF